MNLNKLVLKKKHYLVYTFVFILCLFIFDRGLFYIISAEERKFYKKKDFNLIFSQKRDFNKQFLKLPRGTYSTLILGSSRTYRGLHPLYIYKGLGQKAFKIAKAGKRSKFNYFFYKEYKKYAGIPKVLIVGVDYFMFMFRSDQWFLQFLSREDERKPNNGLLLLISNKSRIDTFFTKVLDELNKRQRSRAHPGQGEIFNIVNPFIGYGKQAPFDVRKPPRFKTFKYIPYPGKEGIWFLKLLKELEKDGVTVILVLLPEYIGTYESNFQQEAFIKDIRQIKRPFKNVFIYNYNLPGVFPLSNAAYFLDGGYGKSNSHLSRKGCRVFNRMLVKDLKKHYVE